MNDRRSAYYPALAYSLLLLLVWGGSWLIAVVQLFMGDLFDVNSLVSGEGVRWALFSVDSSVEAAPWGTAFFLLFIAGLLDGSGLLRLAGNIFKWRVSGNELRSLLFALSALVLYVVVLFLFTLSPWDALRGVTGGIGNSPLSHGWLLLLSVGVLMTALVYGFMYGNYRTVVDVIGSAAGFVRLFVPALLAMLPASGLMPCLHYTGLDIMFVIDNENAMAVETVIYCLPFVYMAVMCLVRKR